MRSLLWTLAVVACVDSTTEPDPTDTVTNPVDTVVDTVEAPCGGVPEVFAPEHDDDRIPVNVTPTVAFADVAEGQAVVELAGPDGPVEGAVTWNDLGDEATFTPAEPLLPETTYIFRAEHCDVVEEAWFTTGLPPIDAEALVGTTWVVPWSTLVWEEPGGADTLAALADFDVIMAELLGAEQVGDQLRMAGAGGYDLGGGTYLPECVNDVVPADFDFSQNPIFSTTETTLSIPIDATTVPVVIEVHEFRFRGTFVDDGATIDDFRSTGLIDLRGVGTLLGGVDACLLFQLAGSSCQACPDGVAQCIWMDVRSNDAVAADGASITEWCR
jgi:hypothetical protein